MLDPVDENIYQNDELKHWGIIGMKWGIRRYQNPDGTLTEEGKKRYGNVNSIRETKKPSYSQKYESLKYKKDRTSEEEKEYQRLERGKQYYLDTYIPSVMNKKVIDIKTPEESMEYSAGLEFFLSTNYGKRMFDLTGTPLGGSTLGSTREISGNDIDFYRDMLFRNDKQVMRPAETKDLDDYNLKKVMKIFGVKKSDLVVGEDGTRFPPIYRKDGKPFKYTTGEYDFEDKDLRNIAWEGDWPMNKQFKAIK